MHIDIHILQPLPLSTPNRDDLGQPKTVHYGGVERGRISSQSAKRVVRHRFEARMGDLAVRTRTIPAQVAVELQHRGWQAGEATAAGQNLIRAADIRGLTVEDNATSTMLFLPKRAIGELADLAAADQAALAAAAKKPKSSPELSAQIRHVLTGTNPSIALMGRMLADHQGARVDGALAVAHAMTTHAAPTQPDFFAAVDDLTTGVSGGSGSGMMGTAAHNAGVWYRYATLNTTELVANLAGDLTLAQQTTKIVLEELASYTPEARGNSTAPHTPPALVYLALQEHRPISLAGAFEQPVRASRDSGWLTPSITALTTHAEAINAFYGRPQVAVTTGTTTAPELGTHLASLTDAVAHITTAAYPDPDTEAPQ